MAAEVLPAMSALNLGQTVLPPSPASQGSPRHGRSRAASFAKGKNGHRRGYSINQDRESLVSKALSYVLKRSVTEEADDESDDGTLAADSEGWVDLDDVLEHPHVRSLAVTLADVQTAVSTVAKARLSLRQEPDTDAEDPASYQIRLFVAPSAAKPDAEKVATKEVMEELTAQSPDLPEFVIYESSYPRYPLILASGGIKRAGGQGTLAFTPVRVGENGVEMRPASDADVGIYINLRAAMAAEPAVKWQRSASGSIATAGDAQGTIPLRMWSKAVARRPDIGVLFENGQIRKEVPVGLRGKGAKGKKGKGALKSSMKKNLKGRAAEESSSSE